MDYNQELEMLENHIKEIWFHFQVKISHLSMIIYVSFSRSFQNWSKLHFFIVKHGR